MRSQLLAAGSFRGVQRPGGWHAGFDVVLGLSSGQYCNCSAVTMSLDLMAGPLQVLFAAQGVLFDPCITVPETQCGFV